MNSTKIFKVIEFIKYEEKVTFFFLSKCFSKHPIINLWCRPHFSHRILSLSSTATQWPIKKKFFSTYFVLFLCSPSPPFCFPLFLLLTFFPFLSLSLQFYFCQTRKIQQLFFLSFFFAIDRIKCHSLLFFCHCNFLVCLLNCLYLVFQFPLLSSLRLFPPKLLSTFVLFFLSCQFYLWFFPRTHYISCST